MAGSVDKLPSGRWKARWRDYPNGPQRSKTFDKKSDAQRHLTKVEHDQLLGAYVDPTLGRTSFAKVAERYLARGAWRERTKKTAAERIAYAVAAFGDRPVSSIKKGDVQAFVAKLDLAPSTVKVVHQHLAAALEAAVDDGLIVANPARKVKLPRVDRQQIMPVTTEDIEALIDASSPWFRIAIVLGAGLGLRLGEAAGLTVERIDFLRQNVRIDRQWQQASGAHPGRFAPPKTDASVRSVPVSSDVLHAIAAHLSNFGDGGSDRFVVHADGRPVSAPKWEYEMRKSRKAAGLNDAVTFHDLRHFYASALISARCSVKAVQVALGHSSAKMTLDVYGHLFPGNEEQIRAATEGLLPRSIVRDSPTPMTTVS